MKILGVDIGGSSLKTGIWDTEKAELENFAEINLTRDDHPDFFKVSFGELVDRISGLMAVGVGYPNIVREGIIIGEGNMHPAWDRISISDFFQHGDLPIYGINDADAAGFAEINGPNGAALSRGVTVFLTLGTGIGSAVFNDGKMLPNSEMGLVQMHGMLAEQYAAPSIIIQENLTWEQWTGRLQEYLNLIDLYLAPDHIVIGGGISRDWGKFGRHLQCNAVILPAAYREQAGVIGAARYAETTITDHS